MGVRLGELSRRQAAVPIPGNIPLRCFLVQSRTRSTTVNPLQGESLNKKG